MACTWCKDRCTLKCIWLTTICHSADGPPTPTDASFYLEIPPSLLKLASKFQTMCNRENWISSLARLRWWHSSKTWHLCWRQQTMSNQEATNKFVPSKHRNPSQTTALPCSYCCNYGRCACTRSTSHLQVIVMRQLSLICLAVQQTIISGFKTDRLGRAHFSHYGYPPFKHTPGMWHHTTWPITFKLGSWCVWHQMFWQNWHWTLFSLSEKFSITVDWTGSTCLGQIIIWHVFLFLWQQCILLMWRI